MHSIKAIITPDVTKNCNITKSLDVTDLGVMSPNPTVLVTV
jgi:hypothetical protein